MNLELRESLSSLVTRVFTAARRSESLTFSDTEVSTIQTTRNIQFQLRYCPALAKKPTTVHVESKPKPDPFLDPPASLLISGVPAEQPSHVLVLNKYPVITRHFILATWQNKPQTDLLEEDDVALTYACLKAWRQDTSQQGRLFAFFNSGEHSGASQPHRHLQLLPIDDMQSDAAPSRWKPLVETLIPEKYEDDISIQQNPLPSLPFVHFAAPLPTNPSPRHLHQIYAQLYAAAANSAQTYAFAYNAPSTISQLTDGSAPTISYNLAMTDTTMAICPRRAEGAHLISGDEDTFVALNGTLLAGTLLVKSEKEWDLLRTQSGKLDELLQTVGIPTSVPTTTDIGPGAGTGNFDPASPPKQKQKQNHL